MAEGFARHIVGDEESLIESAGVRADGLNPIAVKVMEEAGVDITTQTSKKISSINLNIFDVIVTVCEHARETCPIVLHKKIIHKKIVDPVMIRGTEDEKLLMYKQVRNEIRGIIINLLNNYDSICQERN